MSGRKPPNRIKPNAPRFHALLEQHEGSRVLIMMRSDWDELTRADGELALLTTGDLSRTPLAHVPTLLFATSRDTGERVQLELYRADVEDMPKPINVDTYEVWRQLPSHIDVPALVSSATTSMDDNFNSYLNQHVFLKPVPRGPDHHQSEIPDEVLVLLKRVGDAG